MCSVCHLLKSGVAALFGPESGTTSSQVQSICDICSVCHLLKSGVAALFGPDPGRTCVEEVNRGV